MESKGHTRLVVGILAHVDAGKTTLAESILYLTGRIRRLGRVDHGDAFLDTHALEKARGITIFSKQARISVDYDGQTREITLLDTPGHVDFSAETERTLQVLDAAILVISGADGVQGHVETLWKLLRRYEVPTYIFINKMDQPGTESQVLLKQIRQQLDENCVDFSVADEFLGEASSPAAQSESAIRKNVEQLTQEQWLEKTALCSEELMESYLEQGSLTVSEVREAVRRRWLFPCYFGSALKIWGVEELLQGIARYTYEPDYGQEQAARVYKIERDANGSRLTNLKVTGGSLRVKGLLGGEKIDQIRIYSGAGYQLTDEAPAGTVCAVTGLTQTYSGQGLGAQADGEKPSLVPVLSYRIELPEGTDKHKMLKDLYQLEEEIPELHILWQEGSALAEGEIHAQVMGQVQIEILQELIARRFGVQVSFGEGSIVYRETITKPVEGVGHFEPLRHYAEVHLLLEPGEPGSGLVLQADCSEDELDKNWQRLVLTHLEEKQHTGVLTNSVITDMRITLIAGQAHLKHTEGGDFRQATYRALRQGLMKGESRLLEPVYAYTLELPTENLGRAMNDIQKKSGSFEDPETLEERSILRGTAPAATLNGYSMEVNAYTRGRGRLSCQFHGYAPCHNEQEVIESYGYDPEHDPENPAGSVFCAHGAGFIVPWQQVEEFAHVDAGDRLRRILPEVFGQPVREDEDIKNAEAGKQHSSTQAGGRLGDRTAARDDRFISQEEIEEIYLRTYGTRALDKNPWNRVSAPARAAAPAKEPVYKGTPEQHRNRYLLVDGYNIIFAWEELRDMARDNVEGARTRLMDILCNYQGCIQDTLILVYDAYKVRGNPGTVQKYHNIHVVYTKEAETADQYIEKTVHQIGRKYQVTVATSDALEQVIIWGQGATRMSAQELRREVENHTRKHLEEWQDQQPGGRFFTMEEKLRQVELPQKPD
ncbi:MAG: TetM/TetW/TetO/TetS family tetracycline resistance ribosomal protection protein [Acetatifactor sp.]|nr:TetM/TetW/TetO/TetS family tetracycline resistance ribosomal protection protein [Acetatifactor sp.]